ncbi:MAG: hypothetical protein WBE76_32200 [Terracidiphilus sp.]
MKPVRFLAIAAALAGAVLGGQSPLRVECSNAAQLNESGHVVVAGHSESYLIRHLPISSFPDLPAGIQSELNTRGCLIPQTYEAHRPENVIHGSFEKPGSSDWAVLCSAEGTVSLLVFFSSAPEKPSTVAMAPQTQRLQVHDLTGVLGFNWGIDPASPEQVRGAQAGMDPRPPPLDHDAIADAVVEHRTVYHYYAKSAWTLTNTGN